MENIKLAFYLFLTFVPYGYLPWYWAAPISVFCFFSFLGGIILMNEGK